MILMKVVRMDDDINEGARMMTKMKVIMIMMMIKIIKLIMMTKIKMRMLPL
jgi:hypothetical protein